MSLTSGAGNLYVKGSVGCGPLTLSAGSALTVGTTPIITSGGTVPYSVLSGVPSTFTPATHTHTVSQITDLYPATLLRSDADNTLTLGKKLMVGT